jgi:hypothetical protein
VVQTEGPQLLAFLARVEGPAVTLTRIDLTSPADVPASVRGNLTLAMRVDRPQRPVASPAKPRS